MAAPATMGELKWDLRRANGGTLKISIVTCHKPVQNLLSNYREYYHKFVRHLDQVGEISKIKVTINSTGGAVASAMGMVGALAMYYAKKHVPMSILIDGSCHSAATLLMSLYCPVYITPTSTIIIHNPLKVRAKKNKDGQGYHWTSFRGLAEAVTISEFVSAYQKRCKMNGHRMRKKIIRDLMAQSKRFEAQEAVDFGLADKVVMRYDWDKDVI